MINAQEYRTVDKSSWGPGPWQDEPDKMQWVDPETDLDCLIVRSPGVTGALCGYVGVPPGHPAHGAHYDSVDVDVHGGLTYAALCQESLPEDRGVCHVPAPGRPADVYWLGFDCAHAWDLAPAMASREFALDLSPVPGEVYRDIAYVTGEVTRLARQLA